MSSDRDRQVMQARELDKASTLLIRVGANAVRRNPIKVAAYVLGLLLCLLCNGWKVTDSQRDAYYVELQKLDHSRLDDASNQLYSSYRQYYSSKGWFFTCNEQCQFFKQQYNADKHAYDLIKSEEDNKLSVAKSKLGVFSEYGVDETRSLFWERFSQGKGFAQRQTKWDALFMGIAAMGRDESLLSYMFRLALSMLFNFTLGVCGAVVAFIFSLASLIRSYHTSLLEGVVFFGLASLAATAFALTWLLGLYAAAAGTAYVGLRVAASSLRIEQPDEQRRHRVQ